LRRAGARMRPDSAFGAQSGIGLVEVLIAVVVLAIVVVPVFNAFVAGRVMVARRGEKRMALRLVERKVEQIINAGYGASGTDNDVSSISVTAGTHPTDPSIVVSEGCPQDAGDDVVGEMTWTVIPIVYSSPGDSVRVKSVEVKLRWPSGSPRDSISVTTMLGA
jgi:Tfp pilus assembly protein PilE